MEQLLKPIDHAMAILLNCKAQIVYADRCVERAIEAISILNGAIEHVARMTN